MVFLTQKNYYRTNNVHFYIFSVTKTEDIVLRYKKEMKCFRI